MSWIRTRLGWKMIRGAMNDVRQPTRTPPLYLSHFLYNETDFDDQGRIKPGHLKTEDEVFADFKRHLADSRTAASAGSREVREDRPPGRYDKWGVRVMT